MADTTNVDNQQDEAAIERAEAEAREARIQEGLEFIRAIFEGGRYKSGTAMRRDLVDLPDIEQFARAAAAAPTPAPVREGEAWNERDTSNPIPPSLLPRDETSVPQTEAWNQRDATSPIPPSLLAGGAASDPSGAPAAVPALSSAGAIADLVDPVTYRRVGDRTFETAAAAKEYRRELAREAGSKDGLPTIEQILIDPTSTARRVGDRYLGTVREAKEYRNSISGPRSAVAPLERISNDPDDRRRRVGTEEFDTIAEAKAYRQSLSGSKSDVAPLAMVDVGPDSRARLVGDRYFDTIRDAKDYRRELRQAGEEAPALSVVPGSEPLPDAPNGYGFRVGDREFNTREEALAYQRTLPLYNEVEVDLFNESAGTAPFLQQREEALREFYFPQIDEQFEDANSDVNLALARAGQLYSSTAENSRADLADLFQRRSAEVESDIRQQVADAQTGFENQRASLEASLRSTGDLDATTDATLRNFDRLSTETPTLNPITGLFAGAATGIGAARRGFDQGQIIADNAALSARLNRSSAGTVVS